MQEVRDFGGPVHPSDGEWKCPLCSGYLTLDIGMFANSNIVEPADVVTWADTPDIMFECDNCGYYYAG